MSGNIKAVASVVIQTGFLAFTFAATLYAMSDPTKNAGYGL